MIVWSTSEGSVRRIWPFVKWLGFSLVVLVCAGVIYQQIAAMNAHAAPLHSAVESARTQAA